MVECIQASMGTMAKSATLNRFRVNLNDVDRNVYETLDLRVSQHPSETWRSVVLRTLVRCLHHGEGVDFGRGGVSSTEEPAIIGRTLTGDIALWVEVGVPSPERLHQASKASPEVWIYPTRSWDVAARDWEKARIHQKDRIRLVEVPGEELDALARDDARTQGWEVTRSEGVIYLQRGTESLTLTLNPRSLSNPK
jgi:uncharacterized protein YaeQ